MSLLAKSNLKPSAQTQGSKKLPLSEVSVVSLENLKPAQKLVPGSPLQIAPGVTLSVMQTATEALLEIDAEASLSTQVAGKAASELTTVQTGQIIKTSEGQYVMVRHMESFILPRNSHESRSADVMQIISDITKIYPRDSIIDKSSSLSEATTMNGKENASKQAELQNTSVRLNMPSIDRKTLVRTGILAAAVALGAMYYLGSKEHSGSDLKQNSTGETSSNSNQTSETAKSRIISSQVNGKTTADVTADSVNGAEKLTSSNPVSQSESVTHSKAIESANSAKDPSAKSPSKQTNGSARNQAKTKVDAVQGSSLEFSPKSVKLTEKDRVTIMEYKLEAKFDRSNARAKLKHFAESFPEGSPARREVERAYNGI